MYAIVRVNTFDPAKLAVSQDELVEFRALHRAAPGFLGSVAVDLGRGRHLALNLWDTEAHSRDGLAALGPQVGRLLRPLMSAPSELIGAGHVIVAELPGAGGAPE